jgi:hypothetical protein
LGEGWVHNFPGDCGGFGGREEAGQDVEDILRGSCRLAAVQETRHGKPGETCHEVLPVCGILDHLSEGGAKAAQKIQVSFVPLTERLFQLFPNPAGEGRARTAGRDGDLQISAPNDGGDRAGAELGDVNDVDERPGGSARQAPGWPRRRRGDEQECPALVAAGLYGRGAQRIAPSRPMRGSSPFLRADQADVRAAGDQRFDLSFGHLPPPMTRTARQVRLTG